MRKHFFILFPILLLIFSAGCSSKKKSLFRQLDAKESGISFNNPLIQTAKLNILNNESIYNGAGVGIGDFNNDSLPDIYFCGNATPNELYLNKGNLSFKNVSKQSNATGEGKWCKGVDVIDINNDGLMDIYICTSIKDSAAERGNILYINQGNDASGTPVFKNMAKEYNLADTNHNAQAAFFDMDNDGDLDVYIVTNPNSLGQYANTFKPIIKDGTGRTIDKLYRNDYNVSLKHAVFTDVSRQAGILQEGYGHAVTIADINRDGYKDIYVTNDYIQPDLLWINNKDGTFTEKLNSYFKHTSNNAMGNDIADINNDGLPDVVSLDMFPKDNYRLKTMSNPFNYASFQNYDQFGYNYQYVRNTLQLNQGPRINRNDSVGEPVFAEIGFYSGIEATDWSWTPMLADFDGDGFKDMIVTNGYPKDMTDHDFMVYRSNAYQSAPVPEILRQIPEVKIHNYAFKNNGQCTFTDVSDDWGLMQPTFSSGAAYADFDNDGDLDFVINNLGDEASFYENTSNTKTVKSTNNFLSVKLTGDSFNINALGALLDIYYDNGKHQACENFPCRGFLSTIDDNIYFGVGLVSKIDSIRVVWPNQRTQLLTGINVNQRISLNQKNATAIYSFSHPAINPHTLFTDVTSNVGISYIHQETDYVDFAVQKLLPHKLSQYGPALAVGDVNGDGLDDMIVGGSKGNFASILLQHADKKFTRKELFTGADSIDKQWEDMGMLLLDVDNDGDLDLIIGTGGVENEPNTVAYQDIPYLNDGKGNFAPGKFRLPKNFTSKSCVKAIDYDKDGDLDLFIGGRVNPNTYPSPASSKIYRNDSKNGQIIYTDVTDEVAPGLNNIGLVSDALWTDFDNDGNIDLIVAGEWMPIIFFKNTEGFFKPLATNISNQVGWFTSIVAGDFDNDGDIDYVVGNLGENSFYKASDKYPAGIYAADFNNDGVYDAIPSLFLQDSIGGQMKEFPANGRDELIKQMIVMKGRFPTYKGFAAATMDKVLTPEEMKNALVLKANNLKSLFIRNDGKGQFSSTPLPMQAQFSMLYGMVADDFDNDGNIDLIINGNDFGTDITTGRYDALNGLFLKGNGKGGFLPLSIYNSGIYIPGDGKALVKIKDTEGGCLMVASQNRGPLKTFLCKQNLQLTSIRPDDLYAIIQYKNGISRKQEFYYGDTYLSQSGRYISVSDKMKQVEIMNSKGVKRPLF